MPTFGQRVPGGKMQPGAKPKTDTDWAVLRAAALPPPGAYANTKAMDREAVPGGKFPTGPKPLTAEDFALKRAGEVPGPGAYRPRNSVVQAMASKGGRFSFAPNPAGPSSTKNAAAAKPRKRP